MLTVRLVDFFLFFLFFLGGGVGVWERMCILRETAVSRMWLFLVCVNYGSCSIKLDVVLMDNLMDEADEFAMVM